MKVGGEGFLLRKEIKMRASKIEKVDIPNIRYPQSSDISEKWEDHPGTVDEEDDDKPADANLIEILGFDPDEEFGDLEYAATPKPDVEPVWPGVSPYD